ncbi:hypothetical protein [Polymorphospora sp. NPDC050346]|uniref:hypothetical protein n=1 Tax=Polymorphospora sp. NPDC050346 TaxID=3155780 RepID=UPI0033C465A6
MDVIENGPPEPRWTPPGWLATIAVTLVAAVIVAGFLGLRGSGPDTPAAAGPDAPGAAASPGPATASPGTAAPAATPRAVPCPVDLAGPATTAGPPVAALAIGDPGTPPGHGLERCDLDAQDGPWTAVVRRTSGVLGRGGAVVTYPVDRAPTPARTVPVGGVDADAGPGWLVWPLGDRHARIRGDLPEADLARIAAATTAAGGRPVVTAPAGFRVVHTGPYASPTVRQVRYGTVTLDEQAALGSGLVVVGLRTGGGLEDQMYVTNTVDAGLVAGRPARVFTGLLGGNAAIAWEPAPGLVGYVLYSGAKWHDAATAALRRLAERTVPLDRDAWRSTEQSALDADDLTP